MPLELKEQYGMLNVYGELSSKNMDHLENRMHRLLQQKEHLILSIERVERLDSKAALMLEKMYRYAANTNRVLSIMGQQNRHITDTMTITNTNYILSSDRV